MCYTVIQCGTIGGGTLAKPIELGLTLDREDSIRFQKYLDNPTYSEEGLQLIREAARLAEKSPL